MGSAVLFLWIIAGFAIVVVIGMVIAVVVILMQAEPDEQSKSKATAEQLAEQAAAESVASQTKPATKQTTYRAGVVLHAIEDDKPVVVFTSEFSGAEAATIEAETTYGHMELHIAKGTAKVQWEEEALGELEFEKQRIITPSGQLLGSLQRPSYKTHRSNDIKSYPIDFFGQKAADVTTIVTATSTLKWFGAEDEGKNAPALQNLNSEELEDEETLFLIGAVLLEFGFFDVMQT
ncbi:MAG: hypothetical protein B6242_04390 [Anaerolineaceae bacterium 4572_78]|nr:MAG: hypothetical protein B6242_04390 [Anaerolineaceae bacterium 4572_78]